MTTWTWRRHWRLVGEGDSIYFDSDMGHALVSTSEEDAIVLSVCTRNDSDPS